MITEQRWITVTRSRGRSLEVLLLGHRADPPLVFHTGTPGAAVAYTTMVAAAINAGLQYVTYSRPGYAGSTASPGRSVKDAADDVAAILNVIEAPRFLTMGWSGGGPHALACAALLPGRCVAGATIASVAPYGGLGLDWMHGMADENVEEFSAAVNGPERLDPLLEKSAAQLATVQGGEVAASLGGLLPDVDKAALTGEFANAVATSFRRAVSAGIEGWRDDDLALVKPWGFDLARIDCPVAVWQGGKDLMVPFAHGQWLADRVPRARPHLSRSDGHLSLAVGSIDRIVADLAMLGNA